MQSYAHHVRILDVHSCVGEASLPYLSARCPIQPLFPGLRRLQWSGDAIDTLPLFCSPLISVLHITDLGSVSANFLAALYQGNST